MNKMKQKAKNDRYGKSCLSCPSAMGGCEMKMPSSRKAWATLHSKILFQKPKPKRTERLKEKNHFDGICGFVFSLWKRKESKNKSWYVTRKVLATCHTGLRRVKSLLRDYIRFTDNGVLNLKLQVCNNRASEHFSIWSIWWIFFSKDRFCLPSFIQFFHILLQLI